MCSSCVWIRIAAILFALIPVASAAQLGDAVEEAVAIHVTNGGLRHLGDAVEGLVPPAFHLEDLTDEFECAEDDAAPLAYHLDAMDLLLSADDVQIAVSEGQLFLTIYATLSSEQSTLAVTGDCSVLEDLDETCLVQIDPTAVEVGLGMSLVEGEDSIDVTVDELYIWISPIQNPLEDCTLASAVGTMLGQDENIITDLILSFVEPELEDIGPTIEEALEGVFDEMTIETSFELGSTVLDISLYPTLIELDEAGIIVGLGASVDIEQPSDCVDWEAGYERTGAGWPAFAETADGSSLPYDIGLFVGKDFADHLLFTAWASGLLCMEVRDLGGAELTTGFMGAFLGDEFRELFPVDTPATLQVDPVTPPVARFEHDPPQLHVDVEQLGLHLLTELDDRATRIFQVDVGADVGLEVDLTAEQLALELLLDEQSVWFDEVWSDLLSEGYSALLGELTNMVIGTLVPDDLLPTLDLPSLMGVDIGALVWIPTQDEAWHGAYLVLDTSGVEPIEVPGCDAGGLGCDGGGTGFEFDLGEALGCDEGETSGCDVGSEGGSCATVGPLRVVVPVGRVLTLMLVLLGAVIRRRRA